MAAGPSLQPQPHGHPPSDAQGRVIKQDSDDVEETREQLQGEVEQPDPQACGASEWGASGPPATGVPLLMLLALHPGH